MNRGSAWRFSALVKYWIHLFGRLSWEFGGRYIVSLRHASRSFSISHLRASICAFLPNECAKPTPASQIYSQLSMFDNSSALSGPDFRAPAAVTVKSGQNRRSWKFDFDELEVSVRKRKNLHKLRWSNCERVALIHLSRSSTVAPQKRNLSTRCLRKCMEWLSSKAWHNWEQLVVQTQSGNCYPPPSLISQLPCKSASQDSLVDHAAAFWFQLKSPTQKHLKEKILSW